MLMPNATLHSTNGASRARQAIRRRWIRTSCARAACMAPRSRSAATNWRSPVPPGSWARSRKTDKVGDETMKSLIALAAASAFAASAAASAATQPHGESLDEARVHKLVEPRMGANVKVDAVTKTGYGGMYEVRSGGDIFYTDANARYMF